MSPFLRPREAASAAPAAVCALILAVLLVPHARAFLGPNTLTLGMREANVGCLPLVPVEKVRLVSIYRTSFCRILRNASIERSGGLTARKRLSLATGLSELQQ